MNNNNDRLARALGEDIDHNEAIEVARFVYSHPEMSISQIASRFKIYDKYWSADKWNRALKMYKGRI